MKAELTLTMALVLALSLGSPGLREPVRAQTCEGSQNAVTDIGERFTSPVKFAAGANEKQKEIPHDGARYLRARIEVPNLGSCANWWLTVRDADFHVIQTFNRADFQEVPNRWTNRVPRVERKIGNGTKFVSKIVFTLDACTNGTGPEIRFPEYVMMSEKAKNPFYSSQVRGQETYRPLYSLTDSDGANTNKPLGDNVGFLMSSWLRNSWTCSGVFLNNKWFLTNWHCGGPGVVVENGQTTVFPVAGYWNAQIVKDTIIDISFDDDGLSQEYVAKSLLASDPDLDFAILEVSPIDATRRIRPMPINLNPLASNTPLKIVHHPAADRKMITIAGCHVEQVDFESWQKHIPKTDFTHKCDTEKGSSGGPVFNANNELVGLHHRGFEVDPATCQDLPPRVNKAVKITKIFECLRASHPEIANELLIVGTPGTPDQCPTSH